MIDVKPINTLERFSIPQYRMAREFRIVLFLTLLHIPLGVLVYRLGPLALLHPIAVFSVGLYWAAQKHIKIERVALVIAYLVGMEVLWRMAQVPTFWEFGKYGSAAIAIVALVRRRHYKIPKLALIYFVVLLPACVLTLIEFDWSRSQATLSTNMSGPGFLLVCSWFFSNIRMTVAQLRQLFCAIAVPLVSVASATLFYTVTIEGIQFGSEGNLITSGGFGPNQVSAALGLGAFTALLCLIVLRNPVRYKVYFVLGAILFSAQSIMTFSRGGMYNALGAILVVSLLEFRDPIAAAKRLAPIAGIVIVFLILVFPVLNDFTDGNLQARFEDTGTTKRADIAESDLEIFWQNPVLGVGVGVAYDYRVKLLEYKAMSHTEFTRLISEHGSFGFAALLALLAMSVINVKRQNSILGRAVVAGTAAWAMLFMLNAGMRLAAPSFMLGLTFITLVARGRNEKMRHLAALDQKEIRLNRVSQ